MTLRNKVTLIGNLGNNPDCRTTEGGNKLAKFSIATNETYRNERGDRVTSTTWHTVIAWNKLADIAAQYLTKGMEVVVEGKIINRSYDDKDGNKRYVTEVQANELLLLGGKPKDQSDIESTTDLPVESDELVTSDMA